jgi:hypothetical protein
VVPLLDALQVEVRGEAGQVVTVEPDRDGDVLLAGSELVADLLGEELDESGFGG